MGLVKDGALVTSTSLFLFIFNVKSIRKRCHGRGESAKGIRSETEHDADV